ncbi:MAG: SEC-C metal-binding domain-containing protein, partial [bacterium]
RLWIDHIDYIDDLREGVEIRAYGQKDPLVEFKNEAFSLFESLIDRIDGELSRRLFRIGVNIPQPEIPLEQARENVDKSDMTGLAEDQTSDIRQQTSAKPGRNDPCPSGSGKKYKKCHYPQYG